MIQWYQLRIKDYSVVNLLKIYSSITLVVYLLEIFTKFCLLFPTFLQLSLEICINEFYFILHFICFKYCMLKYLVFSYQLKHLVFFLTECSIFHLTET